jgi:threonine/homoserine efflux transporter RhtA
MTPADTARARTAGPAKRRLFKTYAILLLFVAQKAVGNLSLAWGMKRLPAASGADPLLYIRAIFDPFVAVGIAALILALLTRMVLLSLADLSFVLPVTAIGYAIAALLGHFVLHETVTDRRWLGTILICAGAALVSSSPRIKTPREVRPKEVKAREVKK